MLDERYDKLRYEILGLLHETREPQTALQLGSRLAYPPSLVENILDALARSGAIRVLPGQERRYMPADAGKEDVSRFSPLLRCEKTLLSTEKAVTQLGPKPALDDVMLVLQELEAAILSGRESEQSLIDMLLHALSFALFFRLPSDELFLMSERVVERCWLAGDRYGAQTLSMLVRLARYNMHGCSTEDLTTLLAELEETDCAAFSPLQLALAGIAYFYRGEFLHLFEMYERYSLRPLTVLPLLNDFFCMVVSTGMLHLRKYHVSFGIIESYRNTSELTGRNRLSLFWRIHLAFFLLHLGKNEEALTHIDPIISIAEETGEERAASVARRALAVYQYRCGRHDRTRLLMQEDAEKAVVDGVHIMPFSDPIILEMLDSLEHGGKPIPGYELKHVLPNAEQGPNRLLRGVSLRLQALRTRDSALKGSLLEESTVELLQTGCVDETLLSAAELASYLDEKGNSKKARDVRSKMASLVAEGRQKNDPFSDMEGGAFPVCRNCINALLACPMPERGEAGIQQTLGLVQRHLGAQRAAMFRLQGQKVRCVCSVNLTSVEIEDAGFQPIVAAIREQLQHAGKPAFYRGSAHRCCFLVLMESEYWLLYVDTTLNSGLFKYISAAEGEGVAFVLSAHLRHLQHEPPALETKHPSREASPYFGQDMKALLSRALIAAKTDAPLLLTGETGTGKERLAQYIYEASGRKGRFVPVQLSCIPEHLFESEMFGYERGAFTGALRQKPGFVELAHQGVLFLDEIGDIPPLIQTKLLRVLQERKFVRVGGAEAIFSDFRLIAATNRNLREEVRAGRFREDLLYRLAVIPLEIPPLRVRHRDLPVLSRQLLQHFATRYGKNVPQLTEEQMKTLLQYHWPGNIRELCGILEQYTVFGSLELPEKNLRKKNGTEVFFDDFPTMEALQERYIKFVLQRTEGKVYGKDGAAALLGMTKSTLYNKIEKYKLR